MRPNALTFFRANSESYSERFGFGRRGHASRALYSLGVACAVTVTLPAHAELTSTPLPHNFAFDAFDRQRDAPPSERASSREDGVYGRFDGEVSLVPFVGATWTQAGMLTELGLAGYYFNTVGIQAKYADGRAFPAGKKAPFSISTVSLALRPLFLLRWSKNLEQGPSWLDLTLDSLTLKAGGYWAQNQNTDESTRGFATELSFGVPLLAKANGPWLGLVAENRLPAVTHGSHSVDLAAGARFEWAFSLGP